MNYHLHDEGRDQGIFPLEELRLRRQRGELTGNELVWCAGMAAWRPLREILQENPPPARQGPPPLPKIKPVSPRKTVLTIVGAVVLYGVLVAVSMIYVQNAVKNYVVTTLPIRPTTIPFRNDAAKKAASEPVVAGATSKTEAQLQQQRREFRVRQFLEGYKSRGDRHPATDAECIGFLNNWIASEYGGTVDTNLPPLPELADRLANDTNCTDPVVLTVTAVECPDHYEAVHRYERAVKAFENSNHRAYLKFYATIMLRKEITGQSDQRRELDREAVQYYKDLFQDGSLQPEDQAIIGHSLTDRWGSGFFNRNAPKLIAITQTAGQSYEWLALVLDGTYQINAAWQARGGGYANTVTDAGWKSFKEHLAQAHLDLDQAWKLRPDLALAPAKMIYVCLGESDITEMRLWFDRATAAQIDDPEAWSEMRWGLRPRWYGDVDSMFAFGLTAVNTRRFDTDVPRTIMDVAGDLKQEEGLAPDEFVFGQKYMWPHVEEMYEGYLHSPAAPGTKYGWRSSYAVVAYLAGKYDVARMQLQAVDWQPQAWNLTGWHRDLSLLPEEVAARTGPLGTQVNSAEKLRADDDAGGAYKTYASLDSANNADARTRRFIQDRLVSLKLEQDVENGGWVDFLPADTNLTGWCVGRGNFRLLPDGALEVRSDKNGHIIFSRAKLGEDFEMKGQFEVAQSSTKSFQAGIVLGLPEFETTRWYSFRMKRNDNEGEVASFSTHWHQNFSIVPIKLNDVTNSFTFKFEGGKVSATVNGATVLDKFDPANNAELISGEFFVGLGAFNDMNDTVIRYRNIQLRQLPAK